MESIVYSGEGLRSIEGLEKDLKNKAKTVIHIDLSNNSIRYFYFFKKVILI